MEYDRAVSDPGDLVEVEESGRVVRVRGRDAQRRLGLVSGRYRLIAASAGMLVLRAEHEELEEGREPDLSGRVLMSGELIGRTSMLEVLNLIGQSGWRGELSVYSGGHRRLLSFDQGAVRNVRSNAPGDRLGEVLYRNGALTGAQVKEVIDALSPGRRFGQIVLERRMLTQEQLYTQLRSRRS